MFKIKLYGTNTQMTLDSEGYVDATDFLSVTNTNIEIDCYFIRPFRALEGEELEFAGGVKETTGLNRRSFDIETAFLTQDEHSFIDEVVTEINTKRYKFIELTDYSLDPTLQPVGSCLPCFISSKDYGEEGSLKNLTMGIHAKYGRGQQ